MLIDRLPRCLRLRGVRSFLLIAMLGISTVSTLWGVRELLQFDHTPGAMGIASSDWPVSSSIGRAAGKPELLVFLHPQCSCSFATIEELSKLEGSQSIDILFYRPRGSGWAANELWAKAQKLHGARLRWDEDGREAHRFGAATSGITMLYSPPGQLLFRGGVTGSRGHEGDNLGIRQLAYSLETGRPAEKPGFVFGCALGGQA